MNMSSSVVRGEAICWIEMHRKDKKKTGLPATQGCIHRIGGSFRMVYFINVNIILMNYMNETFTYY